MIPMLQFIDPEMVVKKEGGVGGGHSHLLGKGN